MPGNSKKMKQAALSLAKSTVTFDFDGENGDIAAEGTKNTCEFFRLLENVWYRHLSVVK